VEPSIDYQNAEAVIELLERAAEHCRNEVHRDRSVVRLPNEGWLLATGDLHDNPFHLEKMLRAIRLDKSPDRHIILHELIHGENLINGMDFSYRMLCRVAEVKCEYPNQVHPLLANHELAQMTGRGVGKGAGDSVELFREALEFVFGSDDAARVEQAINAFIASWPLALITANGFLCAHSLPAEFAMKAFDPMVFDRDLVDEDYEPKTGSAYLMVWGRKHSADHLDRLADLFGVRLFCLGHEHAENGSLSVGKCAIVLNSDHERGAVLPIDLSAEDIDRDELLWSARPLNSF